MKSRKLILVSILFQFILSASFAGVEPEKGVSKQLAESRVKNISSMHYFLDVSIPANVNDPINGNVILDFKLGGKSSNLTIDTDLAKDNDLAKDIDLEIDNDLVIDYAFEKNIKKVSVNGKPVTLIFSNEHIIVPKDKLVKGQNKVEIDFVMNDKVINRREDYLYTLNVPDKARMVFPCFDQPDLKGIFHVRITSPENWLSVTNGKLLETKISSGGGSHTAIFSPTQPISTYVFAFTAGKFKKATEVRDQREISMYYLENDSVKVARNVTEIFDATFYSLKWCADYTGIDYPFEKYDLIAIPYFQFGGMEHVGATYYRASTMFLEANCTKEDKKARANLIFHETAHMWFGDLVTMKWFDEVWIKEVFAGYIADKINAAWYNDEYPALNFMLRHHPSAYYIDRSQAPNPITQELNNLNSAGSLYGPIIYDKSPIVFNIIENLIGSENLRISLGKYLKKYSYSNAVWDDLISIILEQTGTNLQQFSNSWIRSKGMPRYKLSAEYTGNTISNFKINQSDIFNRDIIWEQDVTISLFYKDTTITKKILTSTREIKVDELRNLPKPLFIMLNASGNEYGYFEMDKESISYLMDNLQSIKSPLTRGIVWINLYENFLNGNIKADEISNMIMKSLAKEEHLKLKEQLLAYFREIYWHYLTLEERMKIANQIENQLFTLVETSPDGENIIYYNSLIRIFTSRETSDKLYSILKGEKTFNGSLKLYDRNLTDMAYELAIRNHQPVDSIYTNLMRRLKNKEVIDEANFTFPALSRTASVRDSVYMNFVQEERTLNENKVLKALSLLTHPLVAPTTANYIQPGLQSAITKKLNGSLFFSQRWIETLLYGFTGATDLDQVTEFLRTNTDYPQDLRMKVIQSADHLFRLNREREL